VVAAGLGGAFAAQSAGIVTMADVETNRMRLQGCVDRCLADGRERAAGLPNDTLHVAAFDIAETPGIEDAEIFGLMEAVFGLSPTDAIERLAAINFDKARAELA
jgi:hypothetical protein